jgi:hypothetical protein
MAADGKRVVTGPDVEDEPDAGHETADQDEELDAQEHGVRHHLHQGCRMAYFQIKNPNLDKFWKALEFEMLVYFMVIWNILRPFGMYMVWPFGN